MSLCLCLWLSLGVGLPQRPLTEINPGSLKGDFSTKSYGFLGPPTTTCGLSLHTHSHIDAHMHAKTHTYTHTDTSWFLSAGQSLL